MEYTVDVPYIKQETSTTCWNASYKMMLRYNSMYESMADQLPHDAEMRERGILDSEFGTCRSKLGLTSSSYNDLSTADSLQAVLQEHGPIWCAGLWATDFSSKDKEKPEFKHIVVIRGVRTHWIDPPDVYVNDPYRGYHGNAEPSWWSWSHFWGKLHKVSQNCQHWR